MSDVYLSTLKPGVPLGGFVSFPYGSPEVVTFQGCTFVRSGAFIDSSLTALAGSAFEYPSVSVGLTPGSAAPVAASLSGDSFGNTLNQYVWQTDGNGAWAMAFRYYSGNNYYGTAYTTDNFDTITIYNQTGGPVGKCSAVTYFSGYWYYAAHNTSNNGYIARTSDIANNPLMGVFTDTGTTQLYGITSGNSLLVAVGAGGRIVTSPDGTNWTTRSVAGQTTVTRYAIDYIDGVFYAGGTSGQIATSTDGTTWTARTSGYSYTIDKFVKFNGVVYAVGQHHTTVGSSNGGVTWSAGITLPMSISRSTMHFCPLSVIDGEAYCVSNTATMQRIEKYDTSTSSWKSNIGCNQNVQTGAAILKTGGSNVFSLSLEGSHIRKSPLNAVPVVGHPSALNPHISTTYTDTNGAYYMRVK